MALKFTGGKAVDLAARDRDSRAFMAVMKSYLYALDQLDARVLDRSYTDPEVQKLARQVEGIIQTCESRLIDLERKANLL